MLFEKIQYLIDAAARKEEKQSRQSSRTSLADQKQDNVTRKMQYKIVELIRTVYLLQAKEKIQAAEQQVNQHYQ